jgi:superfamily II RNA helicase
MSDVKYKEFTLDQFQVDAINALKQDKTVIVSAPTGTGKTLIADYIINQFINEYKDQFNQYNNPDPGLEKNREYYYKPLVIYTAPIKALSNQKYREFTEEYGLDYVGILTGDVQINATAPLVIMTTEIYRNMLVSKDPILNQVKYTIFDEVHYLSDYERGTIWEESIIFSPDKVKFLCLSATIPNASEFAGWIRSIKGHEIEVIDWAERVVPLNYLLYDSELGITDHRELKKAVISEMRKRVSELSKYDQKKLRKLKKKNFKKWQRLVNQKRNTRKSAPKPKHSDLVKELDEKDMLPALIFSFSRRDCQDKARELANRFDFSTPDSIAELKRLYDDLIEPELRELDSVRLVHHTASRGIGIHHAGLLPGLKLLIEKMFNLGFLKVLFATETFALGVNMPAKTVGFMNLRKYDGYRNRFLLNNEFQQCAGRAGRRGIDEIGYVVTIMSRDKGDLNEYQNITAPSQEPITSQFTLSYNTVINLVKNHTLKEREIILKSSFDYYIRRLNKKHMWVMRRFNQYLKTLRKLKYISGEKVTRKGKFASKIYTHELLVTEFFVSGLYKRLDNVAIAILLATIMYEERHNDHFKFDRDFDYFGMISSEIFRNSLVAEQINYTNLKRMCLTVRTWCQGAKFIELMEYSNLEEGNIIHLFRNTIDLARQVLHATDDPTLKARMEEIISMLDRDVVKVSF